MLITLTKDALHKPLQAVCGIVEKKNTLPILANVLIESKAQQLVFTATDMEIQICYTCPVNLPDFAITVNARKLFDIVRSLNAGDIQLNLKDNKVLITQAHSRFEINTLPAQDFPTMQTHLQQKDMHVLQISQAQFKHQLHSVAMSMGNQDVRYYLNGALLALQRYDGEAKVYLVSTDGHRMSCSKSKQTFNCADFKAILPRKTVSELLRLLDDEAIELTIKVYAQTIEIIHKDFTLYSKLIDGNFPDFLRLLLEYPFQLTFERLDLLLAMQRVNILSHDKLNGVRWSLSQQGLNLHASNHEQDEVNEDVPSTYNGDAFEIGFKISYWLDILNYLKHAQLTVNLKSSNGTAILKTQDDMHEHTYILMSMRI